MKNRNLIKRILVYIQALTHEVHNYNTSETHMYMNSNDYQDSAMMKNGSIR